MVIYLMEQKYSRGDKVIDSHAHLDDEKFDFDRESVIKNLKSNGVDFVITLEQTWNPQ